MNRIFISITEVEILLFLSVRNFTLHPVLQLVVKLNNRAVYISVYYPDTRVIRPFLGHRVFRVILSGNPGISGSIISQFNVLFGNFGRLLAIFCHFW